MNPSKSFSRSLTRPAASNSGPATTRCAQDACRIQVCAGCRIQACAGCRMQDTGVRRMQDRGVRRMHAGYRIASIVVTKKLLRMLRMLRMLQLTRENFNCHFSSGDPTLWWGKLWELGASGNWVVIYVTEYHSSAKFIFLFQFRGLLSFAEALPRHLLIKKFQTNYCYDRPVIAITARQSAKEAN